MVLLRPFCHGAFARPTRLALGMPDSSEKHSRMALHADAFQKELEVAWRRLASERMEGLRRGAPSGTRRGALPFWSLSSAPLLNCPPATNAFWDCAPASTASTTAGVRGTQHEGAVAGQQTGLRQDYQLSAPVLQVKGRLQGCSTASNQGRPAGKAPGVSLQEESAAHIRTVRRLGSKPWAAGILYRLGAMLSAHQNNRLERA